MTVLLSWHINMYFCIHVGLDTFIKMAKKLPSPELYDVVEGYIKISVECSEIFALLEEENNSEAEVSHALEFRFSIYLLVYHHGVTLYFDGLL